MTTTYLQKRVLTGPQDIHNLAPYKYPWAYDAWEAEFNNNWSPKEQGLGSDLLCYQQTLTEDERRLYFTILSTLTTTDIVVAENLAISIMRHITAPEISLYLGRQIGTETLHSVSYQFMIETLGLDQEEVYTLYLKRPAILWKFELASRYAERLRNAKSVGDIIQAYWFWNQLVEGVWFMAGFLGLMSLPRRQLMTGTGTQVLYIRRDEELHVATGARILKAAMAEEGYRIPDAKMYEMVEAAVHAEHEFAEAEIPSILGYNANTHIQYVQYLADLRLKDFGYKPYFNIENPAPWDQELFVGNKMRNFFEATVTDYKSAHALEWEDEGDSLDLTRG